MPKLIVAPCSTSSLLLYNTTPLIHRSQLPSRPSLVRPYPRQSFTSTHIRSLAQAQHENIPHRRSPSRTSPPHSTNTSSVEKNKEEVFPPLFANYTISDSDLDPSNNANKKDHKPPDERILKLGKTLRKLSPLLPTILINPLPPSLLSPNVTLHLFPSTHPHLPTVKGRTLYRAAIWAVPVAWSSVPLVGNVRLQILSERIVRAGTILEAGDRQSSTSSSYHESDDTNYNNNGNREGGDERLVVRWRTESPPSTNTTTSSSSSSPSSSSTSTTANGNNKSSPTSAHSQTRIPYKQTNEDKDRDTRLSVLLGGDAPIFKLSHEDQFTGLFIFSFDREGRVLTQTIEHAEDARGWERTAKFVTLTDWLIGKARGSLVDPSPSPAGLAGMERYDDDYDYGYDCGGGYQRDGGVRH